VNNLKNIFSKFFIIITFLIIYNLTFNINNCISQWMQMSNGLAVDKKINALISYGSSIYSGTINGIYKSTDNGESWNLSLLSTSDIYCFASVGGYLFAGRNAAGVCRTSNDGINWSYSGLTSSNVYSLLTKGSLLFAGSQNAAYGGVYISTDYGGNWNNVSSGLQSSPVHSFTLSGENIFAGVQDSPFNGVYFSVSNGSYWINVTNDLSGFVYSLAVNGTNVFAGTSSNGIYISTNNGGNWTQTGLTGKAIYCILTGGNNVFAGTSSGVYLSTDNGSNWIVKNDGFTVIPSVRALLISNNYVFAGTYNQSVWRRPLSDIIGINIISEFVPEKYFLSQNYPNPFNPSTNIRYELPKTGFVKLVVLDALGREIETLVNEKQTAGTYEATFNASQYTSGVYFYRFTTDNFSETKKMLLIK
jgi:hypothetical protein